MDPQKLEKLADLFGHDLTGWQIAQCHYLELEHGLMGTFPAIDQKKEVIATLDKSALEKVWNNLERRPAKITSLIVIAHPESGIAFNLESYQKSAVEPFHIFSAEAIDSLCQKKGSVRWASGLLPLSEETVHDPVFA